MFREKRSDTRIETIESMYGINLHVRGDTKLGNLLAQRGFDSLTQLLQAYSGKLRFHPRRRRLFLSFHADNLAQVRGFRLMSINPNVDVEFYDSSVRVAIDSENASYVRSVIKEKIRRSAVLVCLIGNGTAWRDWVDWEIKTAIALGKGVCGVRLKGSRGRAPLALVRTGAPIARWDTSEIIAAIERAAARRN